MLTLAHERDIELPADSAEGIATYMRVSGAATLEEYLARFEVTLSVLQDAEALERAAYELVLDHATENARYVEIRFCPLLNTERDLTSEDAVEAALRGMRRAEIETAIGTGLIVCALRTLEPARSLEMAELAVAFLGRGVCGFDLAGAEAGHPVSRHAGAFDRAAAGGVPVTIHAGEAYGPDSIRQALEVGHARRIGHGTRLHEDPGLLDAVRTRRIPLEVCLTSNVQTGVVPRLAEHPARRYVDAGVPIVLSTDNHLMSGVTLTDEYRNARDALGLTGGELTAVARAGFEHAFVSPADRDRMLRAFDRQVAALEAGDTAGPRGG